MTRAFVDTSFLVALLCEKDEYHALATEMMRDFPFPLVTTQWVLAELGNFLCDKPARNQLSLLVSELESDPGCEIRTADDISFRAGLDLYTRRPDKEWSFVDCTSIVVIESLSLTDVLTVDHHFQQAGFNALLL